MTAFSRVLNPLRGFSSKPNTQAHRHSPENRLVTPGADDRVTTVANADKRQSLEQRTEEVVKSLAIVDAMCEIAFPYSDPKVQAAELAKMEQLRQTHIASIRKEEEAIFVDQVQMDLEEIVNNQPHKDLVERLNRFISCHRSRQALTKDDIDFIKNLDFIPEEIRSDNERINKLIANPLSILTIVHLHKLQRIYSLRDALMERFPSSYQKFINLEDLNPNIRALYTNLEEEITECKYDILSLIGTRKGPLDDRLRPVILKILDSEGTRNIIKQVCLEGPFYIEILNYPLNKIRTCAYAPDIRTIIVNKRIIKDVDSVHRDVIFEFVNILKEREFEIINSTFEKEVRALCKKSAESKLSPEELQKEKNIIIEKKVTAVELLELSNFINIFFPILKEGVEKFNWNPDFLKDEDMAKMTAEELVNAKESKPHRMLTTRNVTRHFNKLWRDSSFLYGLT
jgi:hypothetical protein